MANEEKRGPFAVEMNIEFQEKKGRKPKGFATVLRGGKRTVALYKHPSQEKYKIIAENSENIAEGDESKTTEICFSGEALDAIYAMLKKLGRTGSYSGLILPSEEPSVEGRWVLIEAKEEDNHS